MMLFAFRSAKRVEALPAGAVTGAGRAFPTDRVLPAEGVHRRFDSVFTGDRLTGFSARPLADPDHFDERRAALGVDDLAADLEFAKTIFCAAPTSR